MTAAETPRRALRVLHDDIDRGAASIAATQGPRLTCHKGCSACCVDDLSVFEVEAERIREHHAALLAEGQPHPPGACAFLDGSGACRIYSDRPYVCRTQGLPLRWLDELEDGVMVEYRDICPSNEAGPPLEEIRAEDCWSIGPVEEALARLQMQRSGGELRRVALRSMFR